MKHLLIIFLGFSFSFNNAQTIQGYFPSLAKQQIKLTGFEGFRTYTIDSVQSDENGVFQLTFGKKDHGMGYIAARDIKPFYVILAEDENLKLGGENFAIPQTVQIISGKQNQLFGQYAVDHPKREQALSAWDFLEKIYWIDTLFSIHEKPKNAIMSEKNRIREEDRKFLENIDSNFYVAWYLPVRKLVNSVSAIAQYHQEEIPGTINALRNLDYSEKRLYKSGLLREAIEAQFWLIENRGKPMDSVYAEMNTSIDLMMGKLLTDEQKLNEITEFLFGLLERHSLFGSSEYLALKVLNHGSCTIDQNLAAQLESYRAMKTGNIAPDIKFEGDVLKAGLNDQTYRYLSEIRSNYKLIIFGASWCPKCNEEIAQIPALYPNWKTEGLEVIFISLDSEAKEFTRFVKSFPFLSTCDYKKWESKAAKDYYVFATPTMFLLNNNHEIILRPNSVKQIDSWVNYSRN